jgi:hypothetical protein
VNWYPLKDKTFGRGIVVFYRRTKKHARAKKKERRRKTLKEGTEINPSTGIQSSDWGNWVVFN